jgi:paraquat-inducible protein B
MDRSKPTALSSAKMIRARERPPKMSGCQRTSASLVWLLPFVSVSLGGTVCTTSFICISAKFVFLFEKSDCTCVP